jgi:site-specific recombinase XerD
MIEDMSVRGFNEHTRRDYVRHVRSFAAFIGRSPDMATAEDLRLFQLHQTRIGMQPPSINGSVSALRFFFTVTLDRPVWRAGSPSCRSRGGYRRCSASRR